MSGEPHARRTNDHALFDELAVGWALHALEPEDETLFVRHLPDCARCTRTVSETSEVMAGLATDLPPAEPPPVRRATGFPQYEHVRTTALPPQPNWRRVLPSALVAAAVAAILGLGTWNVMISEARSSAEAAAAQQSEVVQKLLQPGQATIAPLADDGGRHVATVVARRGSVQVVSDGLPVNDSARFTYVVWGMGDTDPVPIGTFDVARAQTELHTVGSGTTGLDDFQGYAVSLEPGRQMPRSPSDVVAHGQVTS